MRVEKGEMRVENVIPDKDWLVYVEGLLWIIAIPFVLFAIIINWWSKI